MEHTAEVFVLCNQEERHKLSVLYTNKIHNNKKSVYSAKDKYNYLFPQHFNVVFFMPVTT